MNVSEDILEEKLKIKPLTKAQMLISIDRLTRFKATEEKYLRVFKDIIVSNLISPKYKKSELDLMENFQIKNLAQEILNYSIDAQGEKLSGDFSLNEMIMEYEKKVFVQDENSIVLLENEIDYKSALKILESEDLAVNVKWLKCFEKCEDQICNREKFSLKFPVEKVVVVEGITEEILLPKFAKLCGFDFDKNGIILISAGGKNQVVKLFYKFTNDLKLPVFVLLDNDANESFYEIQPKLQKKDCVHVIASGEFEDILPLTLIKRTLNKFFMNALLLMH